MLHDHEGRIAPHAQSPPRNDEPAAPPPASRGCLYALSQPPLILFLAVIGALLFCTALHDLLLL